jgi:lathosterol oxidase
MDIVLEIVDTLILDRLYSAMFPASPSEYISQKFNNLTSSTFSSVREGASPSPQYKYIFEPASQIINLEPTHWAYSSSLPRDNIYRQGVSLFLIVWYVYTPRPRP